MARPAPAASRAIDIINHLVAAPTRSFTLTEIARSLDINSASAHALLAALSDAGYLVRHPVHKTYSLGPVVAVLGSAAREANPVVAAASAALRRLNRELGVQIVATARTTDEIVAIDSAGRYTGTDPSMRVGQRLPLVPPLGTVFLAWAPQSDVDAWLARAPHALTESETDLYQVALEWARKRGFAIGLAGEARVALLNTIAELSDHPRATHLRARISSVATRLAAEERELHGNAHGPYMVSHIAAPVFSPHGDVVLGLSAHGFTEPLTTDQIDAVGEALRRGGLSITSETRGETPTDW